MKVRIEGCTPAELADYSPYLSLEKVYEATEVAGRNYFNFSDDCGKRLNCSFGPITAHLPEGARWVKLSCCEPTVEELQLIADGDFRPEELWGGARPTCPECIGE